MLKEAVTKNLVLFLLSKLGVEFCNWELKIEDFVI